LQAGKVRLIFVSDRIPDELRRIVEFLNEQMNQAEVLALEIRQYVSHDSNLKTLVPRLIGQTSRAQTVKSGGTLSRQWDQDSFFETLDMNRGPEETATARGILKWCEKPDKLPRIEWNARNRHGVFEPCLDHKGTSYWPIGVRTDGRIEIIFQWLKNRQPFVSEAEREELLHRLNEIAGIHLPAGRITGRPSFQLFALNDETALQQFFGVLDWFVQEVKAT
jgi:hypothetical protein